MAGAPARRLPKSEKLFQDAVKLMRAGDPDGACRICARLLKADPGHLNGLHLQAVVTFQAGDPERGIALMEKVLDRNPRNPSALNDMGMILNGAGRPEDAIPRLERALALNPQFAGAYLNLGNAFQALHRHGEAERYFREALRFNPQFPEALRNISHALLDLMQAGEAAEFAGKAVALAPKNSTGYLRLGEALDRLGRFAEAEEAFKTALTLEPGNAKIRMAYARCLGGYGHFDAAMAQCRAVLAREPDHVMARVRMAIWGGTEALGAERARMEDVLDLPETRDRDRMALLFALGQVYEKEGDFAAAFAAFDKANALRRMELDYSREGDGARFAAARAAFTPDIFVKFAGAGSMDPTPIFVVGTPRSGTTLTEQILASHPRVEGAGELSFINGILGAFMNANAPKTLAETIAGATPEELQGMGDAYVEKLRIYAPDAEFVVDKMPENFLHIGFIHLILPNARIVHTKRNAMDACLSMFKNSFSGNAQGFSYDIDDLAHYHRCYRTIMAYWDKVLPGVVYHLDYQALTADQEGETRKLLAGVGLEWSEQCLKFFESKRPVHSASIAQVRKPLYSSSVGLADKYGAALDPLRKALED